MEAKLQAGKSFHYTKVINHHDIALSIPTEMGITCIFTLDNPTLISIKGRASASFNPKLSSGGRLHLPQGINFDTQVTLRITKKTQAQLGFITSFDHYHHLVGYDRNVQLYLPLRVQVKADFKNSQHTIQVGALKSDSNVELFHFSSLPYIARHDILDMQPVLSGPNVKIINTNVNSGFETVIGDKSTGVALRVKLASEKSGLNLGWLYEQARRHDLLSALMAPWYDEVVYYGEVSVNYDGKSSINRQMQIQLNYKHNYESSKNQNAQGEDPATVIKQLFQPSSNLQTRLQELYKLAASRISNAFVGVYGASVKFEGQKTVEYGLSVAVSKSQVDPKSKIMVVANKHVSSSQTDKNYQVAFTFHNHIPNPNGLNPIFAIKANTEAKIQADFAFGENFESAGKIKMEAHFSKSLQRREELQQRPETKQCSQEMQQGNNQLPACFNLTVGASLLDQVSVKVQYEKVGQQMQNMTQKLYHAAVAYFYNNFEGNSVNPSGSGGKNQLNFGAQFHQNFRQVNISLQSENRDFQFSNVVVNDWFRPLVSMHPTLSAQDRFLNYALGFQLTNRKY